MEPIPLAQESVLYALAMYGPLPLAKLRDYSDVRGRALSGALTGLRRRGLAWCGATGTWHATDAGYERGRA
jgi:hypothetical protein